MAISIMRNKLRLQQDNQKTDKDLICGEAIYDESDYHWLIEKIAYIHAERRGFEPGKELDDWLAAEIEVKTRLGQASVWPEKHLNRKL